MSLRLLETNEFDNPGMYTTDTVDREIMLAGELVLELDDGAEVTLRPVSDTLIAEYRSVCPLRRDGEYRNSYVGVFRFDGWNPYWSFVMSTSMPLVTRCAAP